MDIVVWLRNLGLGKYEAIFRENDIDETVLRTLTADDLKELGVTSFGHRRKLLESIAALRADTNIKVSPVSTESGQPSITTRSLPITEAVGERRHVTNDRGVRGLSQRGRHGRDVPRARDVGLVEDDLGDVLGERVLDGPVRAVPAGPC